MFKTQVLSYEFGSIKNKIKNVIKNPLKTGPAMAGPDGQVATALWGGTCPSYINAIRMSKEGNALYSQ